jgi:hypothetical protein
MGNRPAICQSQTKYVTSTHTTVTFKYNDSHGPAEICDKAMGV